MNLDDQHPNYKKLEKKHHDQSLIIYKKNEQCEEKEREIHLLEKRRNQYQRISQTKREKKKKMILFLILSILAIPLISALFFLLISHIVIASMISFLLSFTTILFYYLYNIYPDHVFLKEQDMEEINHHIEILRDEINQNRNELEQLYKNQHELIQEMNQIRYQKRSEEYLYDDTRRITETTTGKLRKIATKKEQKSLRDEK